MKRYNKEVCVVFMEFTRKIDGKKEFFAGSDEQAILKDTEGGKSFFDTQYNEHRIVSEEEVRLLKPEVVDTAIDSLNHGRTKSFFVGVAA